MKFKIPQSYTHSPFHLSLLHVTIYDNTGKEFNEKKIVFTMRRLKYSEIIYCRLTNTPQIKFRKNL